MAYTISLTQKQLDLVLAAVAACTPSGGGSPMRNLGVELTAQTNCAGELGGPAHVAALRTAAKEYFGDDAWMELEAKGLLPNDPY